MNTGTRSLGDGASRVADAGLRVADAAVGVVGDLDRVGRTYGGGGCDISACVLWLMGMVVVKLVDEVGGAVSGGRV